MNTCDLHGDFVQERCPVCGMEPLSTLSQTRRQCECGGTMEPSISGVDKKIKAWICTTCNEIREPWE